MFQMTNQQAATMKADMDAAAAAFWAYPSDAWQAAFQTDWLQSQFGVDRAQGPDGLVFGADD